jgi:hypothetical protein
VSLFSDQVVCLLRISSKEDTLKMTQKLQAFLSLSIGTFLLLFLIQIALPAVFLLLQVPSFALGSDPFWLIRWNNTASGSGIQFNVLFLVAIALLAGSVGVLSDRH